MILTDRHSLLDDTHLRPTGSNWTDQKPLPGFQIEIAEFGDEFEKGGFQSAPPFSNSYLLILLFVGFAFFAEPIDQRQHPRSPLDRSVFQKDNFRGAAQANPLP